MSIMGIQDPVLLRLQDRPDLTFTSLCRASAFAGVTGVVHAMAPVAPKG